MIPQVSTHITLLHRLVTGPEAGGAGAWDEFAGRYGELIRAVARRHGLQPADCDDVLQEVLLGLSKAMPDYEYDPARAKFRTYLRTFVQRAVYRRFRQKGPRPGMEVPEGDAAPAAPAPSDAAEALWEEEWRRYHLGRAMKTIEAEFNEADRAAFDAYVGAGQGAAETAALLGLSVDQVYQAKSRILKRLSALIATQVEEEG
jgi:RNA polymerase sigma-70 factor (ECF subfamily)